MELWRKMWREVLAPQLSTKGLTALQDALTKDDSRLVQENTVTLDAHGRPNHACAIGYAGWIGDGLETTVEIEDYFERMSAARDMPGGDGLPALSRMEVGEMWCHKDNFLSFFDENPRKEVFAKLLPEVSRELARRSQGENDGKLAESLADLPVIVAERQGVAGPA